MFFFCGCGERLYRTRPDGCVVALPPQLAEEEKQITVKLQVDEADTMCRG
jgi:hypothetical protein